MNNQTEHNQRIDNQLTSAIYQGQVRHRRFAPRENKFTYTLHMFAINIDELDVDHKPHLKSQGIFGYSWFNPMRFCQADYLIETVKRNNKSHVRSDPLPLRTRIENKCRALGHTATINKIMMLVQVRCFGIYFSPANFYFCYNNDDECEAMLVEVSNTPWNQRHYYLVDLSDTSAKVTDKNFHVSPFMDLAMKYHWRVNAPSRRHNRLNIHIENRTYGIDEQPEKQRENNRFFDVTLALKKQKITSANLYSLWLSMPVMTLKIVGGIYWQALKLFIKRIPFVSYQNSKEA